MRGLTSPATGRFLRVVRGAALAGLAWSHVACTPFVDNLIEGAGKDGGLDAAADAAADGSSGADSGASDASADASMRPDVGLPPPPECDPAEEPDVAQGVFVSPDADDDEALGTPADPFKSISAAIAAAVATQKKIVHLDSGQYGESLTLPAGEYDLALEGGWTFDGARWSRNCAANARESTTLASPEAVGLRATGVSGRLTLRLLTVRTRRGATRSGMAGESTYGVFATVADGATFDLVLAHAILLPGDAGNGGTAETGGTGATGGTGSCTCDSNRAVGERGAEGAVGGNGEPAATSGRFDENGYAPANGAPGMMGERGGSGGPPGQPGGSDQCVLSCSGDCVSFCGEVRESRLGGWGSCGCGGGGGLPGGSGRGGGASVGVVLVGAGARLVLDGAAIQSGLGGEGAAGGSGGNGGNGGSGAAGTNLSCATRCETNSACPCRQTTPVTLPGGAAGGSGGTGGPGGAGGGGSGGPSHALVLLQGAAVEGQNTASLSTAGAGLGSDGAADGSSEVMYAP